MDSLLLLRTRSIAAPPSIVSGTSPLRNIINSNYISSRVAASRGKSWKVEGKISSEGICNHKYKEIRDSKETRSSLFDNSGNREFMVKAASAEIDDHGFKSKPNSFKAALFAFYKLCRPFVVVGNVISVVSMSLLAIEKRADFSPLFFAGVLNALIVSMNMHVYVAAANQLSDVEIDKVNKPYLPFASGELSIRTGYILAISSTVLSFLIPLIIGSWPLFWASVVSFIIGTGYSVDLPFLRWKRIPIGAVLSNVGLRILPDICYFLHIQTHMFKRAAVLPRSLLFATAFTGLMSTVFTLLKDIPDIDGDRLHGIKSLAITLGKNRVFWFTVSLIEAIYGMGILVGGMSNVTWSKIIMILAHSILGLLIWSRAKAVNLDSKDDFQSFYMFSWKLLYAEYLLYPLVR